jgi:hypothetical protein
MRASVRTNLLWKPAVQRRRQEKRTRENELRETSTHLFIARNRAFTNVSQRRFSRRSVRAAVFCFRRFATNMGPHRAAMNNRVDFRDRAHAIARQVVWPASCCVAIFNVSPFACARDGRRRHVSADAELTFGAR